MLERLLKIAMRDTGQSAKVANFLLAWWNAQSCGGFDITDLWGLDREIAIDCCKLMAWVATNQHYPDDLGFREQFDALIRYWRPNLK
jgi:hypothetical protein